MSFVCFLASLLCYDFPLVLCCNLFSYNYYWCITSKMPFVVLLWNMTTLRCLWLGTKISGGKDSIIRKKSTRSYLMLTQTYRISDQSIGGPKYVCTMCCLIAMSLAAAYYQLLACIRIQSWRWNRYVPPKSRCTFFQYMTSHRSGNHSSWFGWCKCTSRDLFGVNALLVIRLM
jgi:hypothetical protein